VRLLVGAALLALAAAAVLLALGWSDTNEALIWGSIGASAAAGAALAGAYVVARRTTIALPERMRATAAPAPEGSSSGPRREHEPPVPDLSALPVLEPEPASGPPLVATAATPEADPEVVAIPERRKYHRPDCRYAKARGAERMVRSAARRRRFTACGICKP
jgi:hypothetical protein